MQRKVFSRKDVIARLNKENRLKQKSLADKLRFSRHDCTWNLSPGCFQLLY